MTPFRSIIEMIDTLHTEEDCREYLETLLWGDAPVCPHCGTVDKEHWLLTSFGRFKGQYKCRYCKCKFNVRDEATTKLLGSSAIWICVCQKFLLNLRIVKLKIRRSKKQKD